MIKIAMVEDNAKDAERFRAVLHDYQAEKGLETELTVFEKGNDFLSDFIGQYDIVFMDIELPDGNGLEISRELRKKDKHVILVFLTNLGQFAINGYEVDALDFMLKPVEKDIFSEKMKRILRHWKRNRKLNVNVVLAGGKKIIKSKNIIYVEVQKHDILYHTKDEVIVERGALKNVEEQLKNALFARPNYCFIVNLRHIVGVDKYDLLLDNGETLQISRNRKKDFMSEFSRYLGGTI